MTNSNNVVQKEEDLDKAYFFVLAREETNEDVVGSESTTIDVRTQSWAGLLRCVPTLKGDWAITSESLIR